MRMKKFLILAAVVAMSVACSKTYEVKPVTQDGRQIGFGTWAESLTRADDPHLTNTWVDGDTFAIFGCKEDNMEADGTTPISPVVKKDAFTGQTVTYTASSTSWDYTPHRFWDVNCERYTFFAFSPSSLFNASADTTNTAKTGRFTSAVLTFSGANNDILVADRKVVDRGNNPATYFASYGAVALQFNHIASLFDLKVKKTNTITATVAVTSVSLTNMDATGTFSVSDAYDATVYNGATGLSPVVTWTPTAQATYTNASGVGDPVTLPTNVTGVATIDNSTATTGDALISNLIIMPQTLRNDSNIQTLNLTYTITPEGGDVTTNTVAIPLYNFDIDHNTSNSGTAVDEHKFLTGKHYTFYVTLDAHAITFTATINDWTTGVGYYYLMN